VAKYQKTLVVAHAGDIDSSVQPGQWVRVGRERKARRLVSSTAYGVVTVKALRGSRVNTAAFRLARDKGKTVVLGVDR
jgi:hypothetical protein